MHYRISLTRSAEQALAGIPSEHRRRIIEVLESLRRDPLSRAKRLKGPHLYSLRVNKYRIISTIRRDQLLVLVLGTEAQERYIPEIAPRQEHPRR